MLFILLTVLISLVLILGIKLFNIETENLGKFSSLKLELKRKEEEIEKLKKKIEEIKNLNIDVEV